MGDLTEHFDSSEFRSRDGAPLPDRKVLMHLALHLERLRAICGGKPLRIVSGHRSVEHNRSVGGATNSRHIVGDAADLPYGYATTAQAVEAGFTGIGSKGAYATHVDTRVGQARWSYPSGRMRKLLRLSKDQDL